MDYNATVNNVTTTNTVVTMDHNATVKNVTTTNTVVTMDHNATVKNVTTTNTNATKDLQTMNYYSTYTPSILHDQLITKIVYKFIHDNDYENDSIRTIPETSHYIDLLSDDGSSRSSTSTNSFISHMKPFYHSFYGVLVSVDISQFTKLSVNLEIEELERVINQVFGLLTSIVYCYNGDIIKFAGDAFYAFWKIDYEVHKSDVCMMTVECCVKMREVFVNVISSKYDAIGIRICSEMGKITFYNVGKGNRFEYLFSGQPLSDIVQADKLTLKGDYVICSSLYSILKNALIVSNCELDFIGNDCISCYKLPKNAYNLFNNILSQEELQQLLSISRNTTLRLKILNEISLRNYKANEYNCLKIEKELSKQLGCFVHEFARSYTKEKELKACCILFIRIESDMDKDTEFEKALKLQHYIFTILIQLEKFEAKLRQYIIDDKGLIAIASVGLSKTSWRNCSSISEVAINTAFSIQRELRRRFSVNTIIGITKGKCYFGNIGWLQSRVEYSIMGPTVNAASRLMSAGIPGDIICDALVHKTAFSSRGSAYSFQKNVDLLLKGFEKPVENFKIIENEYLNNANPIKKERLSVAYKVLRSGFIISEQNYLNIISFMFKPSDNDYDGDIAVYLLNAMKSVDVRTGFSPKYCCIEDKIGEGINCVLESLFDIFTGVIDVFELSKIKVIRASCAAHDNIFVTAIKKYIKLWMKSTSLPLSDLKTNLQLNTESSEMIDIIQESYLSWPSKKQTPIIIEIFDKISTVFDELLIIFIDQSEYLSSMAVEIFKGLSNMNLKVQFVLSHDVNVNVLNLTSLLQSIRPECYFQTNAVDCTKDDISRYLNGCFEENKLSENVSSTVVNLITECTKGIPSLVIQLIESCMQSYTKRRSQRRTSSDESCPSVKSKAPVLSFEEEVMEYARLDDLIYCKYDILTTDTQNICKLAAIIAIKEIFNLRTLHEIILNYFPELLNNICDSPSRNEQVNLLVSDDNYADTMKSLLFQLLDSKFCNIYDDTNGNALLFKFDLKRERDIIYGFLPLDLKQKYHIYAANVLLKNVTLKPDPFCIYELGDQFNYGNHLHDAIVCYYYVGESLYSIGANKDALAVFEKVYELSRRLFRDILNDDLSKGQIPLTNFSVGESFDWSIFSRYSIEDMYKVCDGSNIYLYAMISAAIRYAQCLLSSGRLIEANQIYPISIQLFVSSRSNSISKASNNNYRTEKLNFIMENGDIKFLVRDSETNVNKTLFGTFDDQVDLMFPVLSGIITSSTNPGYHTTGEKILESNLQALKGILQISRSSKSHSHSIRFMNSLVYAYTTTNSPHLLKHNLALEEETLSLYNFDEHSNEMIVLYGSDLGLESIITGAIHNVMAGNFRKAFQFLDRVVFLLPKLSHYYSFRKISLKLGHLLALLGDYEGALEFYKQVRSKDISAPFALFLHTGAVEFERLIQAYEYETEEDTNEDIEKLRITPESLDAIFDGSSKRISVQPFELSYRLLELYSVGYDNLLSDICLLKAMKIMKVIKSGILSDEELQLAIGKVNSLCHAALNYLGSYIKDDDILESGYMAVKVEALWCKARVLHVIIQVATDNDEGKLMCLQEMSKALDIVDDVMNLFFKDYDDSYFKLMNEYWKVMLLSDGDNSSRRHYTIAQCQRILHEIEAAQTEDLNEQSLLILQRFKLYISQKIMMI